ncbi:MAG: thioredoxin family protein [Verrucomicrobia bacterium]|nr:thioredoxin family protein [Verrucomicrobiota bacterium]
MRPLLFLLAVFAAVAASAAEPVWLTDLDAAKAQAVKENKPVLVDFTGSDWCPPCKALHKNVFESAEFTAVASKYVLVELDYPRKTPQAPELKAKNAELSKQFGITGFPTVLLIDGKSGEVFGKTVGFGGQTAKEYLEKLASFKNTPEGKAALEQEQKTAADRSAQSRVLGQKINDAIAAKDFKAAEAALDEMFADVTGPRKAVMPFNKGRILLMIDPTAKEQALKYIDEALALTAGDETLAKPFKAFREKIVSGATSAPGSAPKGAAPKAAADSKKGA